MSYATLPATTKASAPTATDDASKGYVRGSIIIDTSTNPDTAHVCIDNALGAAVWQAIAATPSHPSLSTLGWSASGHTGATNSVPVFNGSGSAQTVQATEDGASLTWKNGTFQFIVAAAVASVFPQSVTVFEIEFMNQNGEITIVGSDAISAPGSFV